MRCAYVLPTSCRRVRRLLCPRRWSPVHRVPPLLGCARLVQGLGRFRCAVACHTRSKRALPAAQRTQQPGEGLRLFVLQTQALRLTMSSSGKIESAKAWLKSAWRSSEGIIRNRSKVVMLTFEATNDVAWGPTGQEMAGQSVAAETPFCALSPHTRPRVEADKTNTTRSLDSDKRRTSYTLPPRQRPLASVPRRCIADIAEASFDAESMKQVWRVLVQRFESEPKHWRRAYKVPTSHPASSRFMTAPTLQMRFPCRQQRSLRCSNIPAPLLLPLL